MAADKQERKTEVVDSALGSMKIEGSTSPDEPGAFALNGRHLRLTDNTKSARSSRSSTPASKKSSSHSPIKKDSRSQSPKSEDSEEHEEVGGDITVTKEPGRPPKLSRKGTSKIVARSPTLFDDLPDVMDEALGVFECIKNCIYGSRDMGISDMDPIECPCYDEWSDRHSDTCSSEKCVNRATKMECVDCKCGNACQNQRFQRKQYASVSVIKTEKKGYGLRANTDLSPDDFIFEYIGDVINEPTFRKRMLQYDEEGIKHFYFMSLRKNEFVDATKRGNLGRFCNHSCNPNCYVDKWSVGDKLRMGIFAERPIKAGEELVFNYNVDRYGADPQPCYCGEHNCTGFIGGKTQTERATKLSHATIEALGIDDGDGWDTAVAKRPRKKKTGEDDEEYVSNLQPRGLDENGVRKVMATLMQCREKWIAVKLLTRLQRCEDDKVRNQVVQMHGYQILKTCLVTWKEDNNIILQILDILYQFPRLTRNKISDSKIEATVQTLVESEHEDVAFESRRLLKDWSKLEVAYRIPRKKFDPNAVPVFERRTTERVEEVVSSPSPAVATPTGPKNHGPQRNNAFFPPRPPIRRPYVLPEGWFTALDVNGNTYYYNKAGGTTWHRPTLPAVEAAPAPRLPPKSVQKQRELQDIIDSITKAEPTSTPIRTAPPSDSTPKEPKKVVEKWRLMPIEKQQRLYENTLAPIVKHEMDKFRNQLNRDELKKFAKEVSKTLMKSDFKHNRVEDPTKISDKLAKKAKKYVREFFEKAVHKKKAEEKAREARHKLNGTNGSSSENGKIVEDEPVDSTPLEASPSPSAPGAPIHSPSTSFPDPSDLKRKREDEQEVDTPDGGDSSESNKRLKETPPPPPPPPTSEMLFDSQTDDVNEMEGIEPPHSNAKSKVETEEDLALKRQEEDLMRENEEALKMDMDGKLGGEGKMVLSN